MPPGHRPVHVPEQSHRSRLGLARRGLLQAVPAAAVLGVATQARAADVAELVVACDTTLGPALRAAGAAYARTTGVRIDVFPTGPGLILPQLQREVQNDIVVTQPATLTAAVQAGVIAPGAIRGRWQNALALAAVRGAAAAADKPIAVCDPTPASDMDGPAILARLGMMPTPTLGVIDTDTVADLVLNRTARAGLLHVTDIRAHPDLQFVRTVPPAVHLPISYAVAVTRLARRPDPAGFVTFLLSAQGLAVLSAYGLEATS